MKPYNDLFHREDNRIPFCYYDAKDIFKNKNKVRVGRTVLRAMSETASTFMEEVTQKPFFLINQRPTSPRIFLSNINDKFPELKGKAQELYEKYLEKWDKTDLFLEKYHEKFEEEKKESQFEGNESAVLEEIE